MSAVEAFLRQQIEGLEAVKAKLLSLRSAVPDIVLNAGECQQVIEKVSGVLGEVDPLLTAARELEDGGPGVVDPNFNSVTGDHSSGFESSAATAETVSESNPEAAPAPVDQVESQVPESTPAPPMGDIPPSDPNIPAAC